jgi:hypothetical protein
MDLIRAAIAALERPAQPTNHNTTATAALIPPSSLDSKKYLA